MFKVSFKESPKCPSKLVTKMGNETTVMFKGTVSLPPLWKHIPSEVVGWIENQRHIEGYEDIAKNQLIIYSKGVSKCSPNDHYDTILGERLAESRAKYFIYKFIHDLCSRLADYYEKVLYGNSIPIVDTPNEGLTADISKYDKLCRREKQHQLELLNTTVNG